jgi:hypothetical protein
MEKKMIKFKEEVNLLNSTRLAEGTKASKATYGRVVNMQNKIANDNKKIFMGMEKIGSGMFCFLSLFSLLFPLFSFLFSLFSFLFSLFSFLFSLFSFIFSLFSFLFYLLYFLFSLFSFLFSLSSFLFSLFSPPFFSFFFSFFLFFKKNNRSLLTRNLHSSHDTSKRSQDAPGAAAKRRARGGETAGNDRGQARPSHDRRGSAGLGHPNAGGESKRSGNK